MNHHHRASVEPNNDSASWFVVRVKSNCERVVAAGLAAKEFDVCLPMYKRRGSRHKRNKEFPLFPGYVFCRFDATVLLPVLMVPGVFNVLSRGRVPEEVDPNEMYAVQKLAASGLACEAHPFLRAGQHVRVQEGPLEGVEGVLLRERGRDRLVISVSLLLRSVIAEVDRDWVEPLPMAATA